MQELGHEFFQAVSALDELDSADATYTLFRFKICSDGCGEVLHVYADVNEHVKHGQLAVVDL